MKNFRSLSLGIPRNRQSFKLSSLTYYGLLVDVHHLNSRKKKRLVKFAEFLLQRRGVL